jgi:hypothetical protein
VSPSGEYSVWPTEGLPGMFELAAGGLVGRQRRLMGGGQVDQWSVPGGPGDQWVGCGPVCLWEGVWKPVGGGLAGL